MTEFEAATVAYQQATLSYQQGVLSYQQGALALQQGALALQQQQLWAAVAIPLVAFVVGVGQILVVLKGIRVMDRVNQDRVRQVTGQMEAQRAEAEQREKRADQRHAEAMEALRQQGETLRTLVKGMETVIERTAPPRNTP